MAAVDVPALAARKPAAMEAAIDLTADSDATDVDEDDASLQLAMRLQQEELRWQQLQSQRTLGGGGAAADLDGGGGDDDDASLQLALRLQQEEAAAAQAAQPE